ncbi:hypothetical protein HMN09_00178500 [Mycena chlorophos]|uniref:Mixed lineage kinase domain-containing protein n=1 Tax=Mycena chlorophos TaxID=658473 RepID=A0A8H6TNA6_MYCCL|nr:hypothetical protein HMN09_00178500 [Mycena chlorophos]
MPLKFMRTKELRGTDTVLQVAVSVTSLASDLSNMSCFPPAAALVAVVLVVVKLAQARAVLDVNTNKEGCRRLARRCARIALDINDQMLGRWETAPPSLLKNLARLQKTVEAIQAFMKQAADASWKKRLLKKMSIESALTNYNESLEDAARAFQMSTLIEIHYAVGGGGGASTSTPQIAQAEAVVLTEAPPYEPAQSQIPEKRPEIEEWAVEESIYTDAVLNDQGFKRYHQSEVVLRGRPRPDDIGWWAGTSEAQVNGSNQPSLIKRYAGPQELAREAWIQDIKTLQKLYHPNLPQLLGYSSESTPTPFILLSNVRTRSPESFLLDSLQRHGVAVCIENMLRFYADVVDATLYFQEQLGLSNDRAQDFLESASFRVDGSRNVVVGLPPPVDDRNVVTFRSYRLGETLRSAIIKMMPSEGLSGYRQDDAVALDDPSWQLTQLMALVKSLLPNGSEPPGLSANVQNTLRFDEDEPAPTLRQYRQLSIDANSHGYTWNKNSAIPAHKFAVGDLGYIPKGKSWAEFVRLGNLFEDKLAEMEVRSGAYGSQWNWKDVPMRRGEMQAFDMPPDVKCWPIAVPFGQKIDCEVVHESSLVRMDGAWEFLLNNAAALGDKWGVAPESIILITHSGTNQTFAINDFGRSIQLSAHHAFFSAPSLPGHNPHFPGHNSHFPGNNFPGHNPHLHGQNLSMPRIMYLFTAGRSDYEPYWSQQPVPSPKQPALEHGWTWQIGWKHGFAAWAQLHKEDFR